MWNAVNTTIPTCCNFPGKSVVRNLRYDNILYCNANLKSSGTWGSPAGILPDLTSARYDIWTSDHLPIEAKFRI